MLTDLRLQKYLMGQLSSAEEKELEDLMEKNPELKQRLAELEERGLVTRPMWERSQLERKSRRGSKVRYTTILPALLILLLVMMLAAHWFAKPGGNSTFIRAGGNGTAVELLYGSARGWRHLDAGFKPGDSLTFAVRDEREIRRACAGEFTPACRKRLHRGNLEESRRSTLRRPRCRTRLPFPVAARAQNAAAFSGAGL